MKSLFVLSLLSLAGWTLRVSGQPSAPPVRLWSPEQRLSTDPENARLTVNFARSLAACADGSLHAVWFNESPNGNRAVYRRRLADSFVWDPPIPMGDELAATQNPSVACSGESVYVVWQRVQGGSNFVHLRRSEDGGRTWVEEHRLSSSGTSAYPSVAAAAGNVYVVWGDERDGQTEIYVRASTDGGGNWGPETRVSETPYYSWAPTVAAAGNSVYVAWVDTQDQNEEEYFRRSTDQGATWEPVRRLTVNPANSWAPTMAVEGEAIHFVWFDQAGSPAQPADAENLLNRALDLLELPYDPAPVGVMVPHPEEAARRRTTEKVQQVELAAPAWVAAGGDPRKLEAIFRELQAIGDAGAPYQVKERKANEALALLGLNYTPSAWLDSVPLVNYQVAMGMRFGEKSWRIQAAAPSWVAAGGDLKSLEAILRQFEQTRQVAFSEWEVYYTASSDGGLTWSAPHRLTVAPGASQRPSIAASGNRLAVAWFDNRDGNSEIYFTESADSGRTWGLEHRLTADPGESVLPTVVLEGGRTHVMWLDTKGGRPEIYFASSR